MFPHRFTRDAFRFRAPKICWLKSDGTGIVGDRIGKINQTRRYPVFPFEIFVEGQAYVRYQDTYCCHVSVFLAVQEAETTKLPVDEKRLR